MRNTVRCLSIAIVAGDVVVLTYLAAGVFLASFGTSVFDVPGALGRWLVTLAQAIQNLVFTVLICTAAAAPVIVYAWLVARAAGSRPSSVWLVPLVWVPMLFAGILTEEAIRDRQVRRAVERMKPLIAAITRYEEAHKRPPATLADVTSGQLSNPGAFGIRGCRPLEYRPQSRGIPGVWEITLHCPRGWAQLDMLTYNPRHLYPSNFVRLGAWGYYRD